ncbi:OLC1v1006347C2 [Oldenlandia corymbosa var. corymbosa]|uniref:OLC1v1006347C2 n=1 Tax=Oldenlandia corymbosa var. corymbosa TaxID=529605 RepID=A0AAV1DJF0_OLDCO|nr:OLC1v1006347C2 [Oldenlandia corymbosa var. corymbosa]
MLRCLPQSMASVLHLSYSLPLQPPSPSSSSPPRNKIIDCLSSSSSDNPTLLSSTNSNGIISSHRSLKPIVVDGEPPTFVSAPGRRIVAVGDLHGDLDKTRYALEIAGVLSSDGEDLWIGGETVLVQLGDILDRGEDEIAILSLLKSLDIQAKATGGAVFQVNGNHETMNVEGDFRYVDSGAFDECIDFLDYWEECERDWEEAFVSWIYASKRRKKDRKVSPSYWDPWDLVKRQKGVIARSVLLRPGGFLASELARNAVVLKIDDWVFCHGGLLPHHVSYGVQRLNREVSHWMRGHPDQDNQPDIPFIATRGYDSVVWNRLYSRDVSDLDKYQIDQIESILEDTLQAVGGTAMVVGHTPQPTGVNCEFNCSIWRIDVGMSSGVLDSTPEVLEIKNNEARVIRGKWDRVGDLEVVDYL